MKKRKHISKSLIMASIIFALCLSIGVGSIGMITYYNAMMNKYEEYISSVLKLSLTEIDGDDMRECIENNNKSEKYQETQEFLNRIKENYNIEYIYVVQPLNTEAVDNMMYVITGEASWEAEVYGDSITLGAMSGEEYSIEVVSKYMEQMKATDEILYYSNVTEFGYMYTGLLPIIDSRGEAVAILAVDIAIDEIVDTLTEYFKAVVIGSVLVTVLFAIVLYLWMKKRVVQPLEALEDSAKNFVNSSHNEKDPNNLAFTKPDISTNDEIEELADALCTMSEDMKSYMVNLLAETQDKERIASELNVATQIQADMLPRIFPAFPEYIEFDIHATMSPAKEVGGDFYDFYMVDEDHVALVMADVSGKGVPAALFMVIAKTLIKNHAQNGEELSTVFEKVNNQLCENNEVGMFVTAWMAVIDIHTGSTRFVNAGHNHPIVVRKDGTVEWIKCRPCFVLAGMEEMMYNENEMQLEPGDTLYLYTDGVTEALNEAGELYEEERLESCMKQADVVRMSPEELLEHVAADLKAFVQNAEQADDITMLAFQRKSDK